MVNHWGTIICKEQIEMDDYWHSRFVDENDYSYTGDTATLEEYMNTDYSEEQSEEMEIQIWKQYCRFPLRGKKYASCGQEIMYISAVPFIRQETPRISGCTKA